jgi:high-affinity iron transporter
MLMAHAGELRRAVGAALDQRSRPLLRIAAATVALGTLLASPAFADGREDAARRAAAALELAAQEYRLAFRGGVLAAPEEAREAALFVAEARRAAGALMGVAGRDLEGRLADVGALIARGVPPDTVVARAAAVSRWLGSVLGIVLDERPAHSASAEAGGRLYAQQCAQCHGARGFGDGPAAAGLTPPPARLADPAVLAAATPLDVYRRISLGVPGTAMPAFGDALSAQQRWDLVLHVVTLADSLAARAGDGERALALATVRADLRTALVRAAAGDRAGAGAKALDAYLAYEGLEPALRAVRPSLVPEAEAAFAAYRLAAAGGADSAALGAGHARVDALLAQAAAALAEHPSASGLFAESFLLLLREGLEAILILGAIVAVVVKSGAEARKREVRWGAGLAVVASLVTAALIRWLLRVAPAQQEALEGAVMLLAAAVLFYVSYWMVSKLDKDAWQRFVRQRIEGALARGGALALAAAAFLAVYREGFETVLFYQALYGTGGAAGAAPITAGLVLGGAALVGLYVAIERFGVRVPLRPFFAVTGALLYFMAFVFAGRGVTDLQEGSWIGATPVARVPANDFLGIHPTLESLMVQGLLVAALLAGLGWVFVVRPLLARRRKPAEVAARTVRRTEVRPSLNRQPSMPAARPTQPPAPPATGETAAARPLHKERAAAD